MEIANVNTGTGKMFAVVLVVGMLLLFVLRNRKEEAKNKLLEAEADTKKATAEAKRISAETRSNLVTSNDMSENMRRERLEALRTDDTERAAAALRLNQFNERHQKWMEECERINAENAAAVELNAKSVSEKYGVYTGGGSRDIAGAQSYVNACLRDIPNKRHNYTHWRNFQTFNDAVKKAIVLIYAENASGSLADALRSVGEWKTWDRSVKHKNELKESIIPSIINFADKTDPTCFDKKLQELPPEPQMQDNETTEDNITV